VKFHVKLLNFFLNSSIWVAIAVCALAETTCLNFNLLTPTNLLGFIFFGTIFGYNFIKYFEKEGLSVLHLHLLKVDLKTLVRKFKNLEHHEKLSFLISTFSAVVCGILGFKLTKESMLTLLIPALLSFFYAIAFRNKTLRSVSGVKIYVVGIVWSFVTVVLPVLETQTEFNYDVWIMFVQHIVFVIVLVLPFEIRDLKADDDNLGTLPQKIGVQKTKLFGVMLLLVFVMLELFKNEVLEINSIVMPLVFVVTLLFLVCASVQQSKYYASFFVEGIPLFWLLLLLML
jgi:hypothetical protein